MHELADIVGWLGALVGLYFAVIAAVVAGGVVIARWSARHDAMDEFQARVFSAWRPTVAQRMHGLSIEVLACAFDILVRLAWAARVLPQPSDPGSGTPIVLLPGYFENAGAMWWCARHLRRQGFRPILVDFPSTFHGIERNVLFLRERLRALRQATGSERVAIVAHSMGGVVARALLLSEPEHGVITLIALASPFRGTHMAKLGARFRLGASTRDMCPESPFVGRFLPSAAATVPIRSIIAEQENIVSPPWSCVLPGCETRLLSLPVGHNAPLIMKESLAQIEAWLEQDGVLRAAAEGRPVTSRA